MEVLKAPFPWFGGKSKVAPDIWRRFTPDGGSPIKNYVEPFAGSLAILLQRPTGSINPQIIETVNDFDCYVANFWRAISQDPDDVAKHADYPVIEADLIARNNWLVGYREEFRTKFMADPNFYETKIAGWWVWGLSQWIGGGFCDKKVGMKLPHMGGGEGIHSRGKVTVKRKWLSSADEFLSIQGEAIKDRFQVLCNRLRTVRVNCGDWSRLTSPAVLFGNGITGVVLDPPYTAGEHSVKYAGDSHQEQARDVADEVRQWAIKAASSEAGPLLRIALCGYESERHPMPADWEEVAWKATGGYGNQGAGRGRENAGRERVWFSPSCQTKQVGLFDETEVEEGISV